MSSMKGAVIALVEKSGADKFLYKGNKRDKCFKIGTNPTCHIRIKNELINDLHCKIFFNKVGVVSTL